MNVNTIYDVIRRKDNTMSRICKTCGSQFKATGNEQECPTCKEGFNDIMDIIKGRDRTETVKYSGGR